MVLTHIATGFGRVKGEGRRPNPVGLFSGVWWRAWSAGGRLCDLIGRRPAMLAGLLTYGAGTLLACWPLNLKPCCWPGSSRPSAPLTGSVVTQTMLRDSYQGSDLAQVFSVMGIALPCPVLGLVSGGLLADSWFGYLGVFSAPAGAGNRFVADGLLATAGNPPGHHPKGRTPGRWPAGWCVIPACGATRRPSRLFNTMLFGYYSLAPFLFGLGLERGGFGYSGIVLALATWWAACSTSACWAWLVACLVNGSPPCWRWGSGWLVWSQSGIALWFSLPMTGGGGRVRTGDPQCVEPALLAYREVAGSAGALFGLGYYLLLSLGLVAASLQDLGLLLGVAVCSALCCCWRRST